MIQAMQTTPSSRIHSGPRDLFSFAVLRTGPHISKTIVPTAKKPTAINSRNLLKNAGPREKDRRVSHANTNAVNHSTGVFRNQGRGGCATASPEFGAQRRIRMHCSSTPHELGLYFRPFRGHSAASRQVRARCLPLGPTRLYCCGDDGIAGWPFCVYKSLISRRN